MFPQILVARVLLGNRPCGTRVDGASPTAFGIKGGKRCVFTREQGDKVTNTQLRVHSCSVARASFVCVFAGKAHMHLFSLLSSRQNEEKGTWEQMCAAPQACRVQLQAGEASFHCPVSMHRLQSGGRSHMSHALPHGKHALQNMLQTASNATHATCQVNFGTG